MIHQNSNLGACCEIALRWLPQNLSDVESTWDQVMAWFRRTTIITRANVDTDFCRHMTSQYHNGLKKKHTLKYFSIEIFIYTEPPSKQSGFFDTIICDHIIDHTTHWDHCIAMFMKYHWVNIYNYCAYHLLWLNGCGPVVTHVTTQFILAQAMPLP